jgi:hypothetical protein
MAYKTPAPITVTTTQFDVLVGGAGNTIVSVGPGSSGQALKSSGAGVNPAYTTATFPSTATSAGKILRADGTNWAGSTATYPDTAGTSGNILTSDGTNWVSTTPAAAGLGYTLMMVNGDSGTTPSDSSVYFFSHNSFVFFSASGNATSRMYVPFAGTITKIYGSITSGTPGTTENGTLSLRKNNTTDTTISSTQKISAADNPFNATVSIAVVAGDFVEFKFVTPAWVTNPSQCSFSGSVYIE